MLDAATLGIFDTIYATDLVYAAGCWQLCGDAHCCSFTRYKSQMSMLGKQAFQELPLLPGEFEYLEQKGWLGQFGDFEHKVHHYPLADGAMKLEFICSRTKRCACEHDTRTTVCRLYPLLPIFDIEGRLTGVDTQFSVFEEIEQMDAMERACKLTSLPFAEVDKLLGICGAIGRSPKAVFYAAAYRMAKQHAIERLRAAKARMPANNPRMPGTWKLFEGMFVLRQLLDQNVLQPRLNELAATFRARHAEAFDLAVPAAV